MFPSAHLALTAAFINQSRTVEPCPSQSPLTPRLRAQAARRLAAELQRREADLLERQLEQQRSLLQRLDTPGLRPAERHTLLAALRALQAASLSTRAGLAAGLERREGRRVALRRAHPAEREEQPAAKLPARLPEQVCRRRLGDQRVTPIIACKSCCFVVITHVCHVDTEGCITLLRAFFHSAPTTVALSTLL